MKRKFFLAIFAVALLSISCSNNSGKGTQSDSLLQDSTNMEIGEVSAPLSLSVVSTSPTNPKSYLKKTVFLVNDPIEIDPSDISVINIPVNFSNIKPDGGCLFSKTENCAFGVEGEGMEGVEDVKFAIYIDLLDASGNVIGEAVYNDGDAFMKYGNKGSKSETLPFKVNIKPENISLLNGLSLRSVDVNIYAYADY